MVEKRHRRRLFPIMGLLLLRLRQSEEGHESEHWEVNQPAEEVPPELPEPASGDNFARDGMQEKDWLSLVTVHSDARLLAVAHCFGARFGFDSADIGGGDEDGLEVEDEEEHGGALFGACGESYATDEFRIYCDICEKWFHGKCVKITPAKVGHIKQYRCPSCSNKRGRP